MSLHKNLPPEENHGIAALLFSNSSDRIAFSNEQNGNTLSSSQIGKVARQTDNDTFWLLTDSSPVVWAQVGGAGDVPSSRNLTAGNGLTGGGDLSADRTFNVVAHADGSIVVNADDVRVGVLATDAQHGTRGGGTQHAAATGAVAGFMSAADKTKLDGIATSATNTPLSATVPADVTKAAASAGASSEAARQDHKHDISTAAAVELTDSTNAEGAATSLARSNHTHSHGNRGGGSLHAVAINAGASGFMSGADKAKLDGIAAGAVASHAALSGLAADDHTQYTKADGTRAFTGTVSGVTPTSGAHLATKDYVDTMAASGNEWQDSVLDRDLATPPGSPATGARYLIAASPTGDWAGRATQITTWNGSAWTFFVPTLGTIVSVDDENILLRWNGSSWANFGLTVDHGSLAGLGDDDHTQYHTDGRGDARYPPLARTLTAGNGLTGGGDLSANRSFDVVAHADGSIIVNANDVQVGVLATDAQHGNRGGGSLHADVVAAGASGFMSGSDKTKLDGVATGATNTPLSATAPLDVTKAAASAGASSEAARQDHKHNITTAAPGATGVATASAEGSATTLARSDHTHQSNTTPTSCTTAANSIGTSGQPARADHRHQITTGAPGATSVATASATGSSTNLARADHVHQSNTAPVDITKSTAVIGTSGQPARADHKHDVTTAAAVSLATANAEGSATSLARSDHTHDHGAQTLGTHHAVATDSVNGFMSANMKLQSNFIRKRIVPFALMGMPNSDFPVTAIAPSAVDTTNSGRQMVAYSDTTEQGRWVEEMVPAVVTDGVVATSLQVRIVHKPAVVPPAARTIAYKIYYRSVGDNALISAWSNLTLADASFNADLNTHIEDYNIVIGAGGGQINVSAGSMVQILITRVDPAGGTELAGNLHAEILQIGWKV